MADETIPDTKTLLVKAEIAYGVSVSDIAETVLSYIDLYSDSFDDTKLRVDELINDCYADADNALNQLGLGGVASLLQDRAPIAYNEWFHEEIDRMYEEAVDEIDSNIKQCTGDELERLPKDIANAVREEVRVKVIQKLDNAVEFTCNQL